MNGIQGNLPDLVTPKKGELHMQWVDQEWNVWAGCNGASNPPNHNAMQTNHWEWLFKSINALQKDDICFFGGDYVIFAWDSDATGYYGTGKYAGLQQAMRDAMKRGAKVLAFADRYYTGGRDGTGSSVSCTTKGTPWAFDDCSKTGLYCGNTGGWCSGVTMGQNNFDPTNWSSLAYYAKSLKDNNQSDTYNYLSYDIPGQGGDDTHPHTHTKLISFYYKSTNRFSVFKGGWNLSTWSSADGLKETGMGLTGLLSDPVGQLMAWGDLGHLRVLENNSSSSFYVYVPDGHTKQSWYGADIDPTKVSAWFKKNFIDQTPYSATPPPQPLTIPTLYFMGPSFGTNDNLFGCGAVNSGRALQYPCHGKTEDWIKITEHDVNLCLGYDPMPQGKCTAADKRAGKGILAEAPNDCWNADSVGVSNTNWAKSNNNWYALRNPDSFDPMGGGTPQAGFPWGMDLIISLMDNSSYLKTMMHSQLIGTGNDSSSSGAVPIFYQSIIDFCKKHKWFTITNPDNINNPTSLGAIINKNSKDNWFPRFYEACGVASTHDKLWISDKGFILGSGHPQMMHYNQFLTNCELLMSNCPALTAYMNNHFNSIYAEMKSPGNFGGHIDDITAPSRCPVSSQTGACRGPSGSQIVAPRQGWESFTGMPPGHTPPPTYYTCNKDGNCVEDTSGSTNNPNDPTCNHQCSKPGPNKYYTCNKDGNCVEDTSGSTNNPNDPTCNHQCSKHGLNPWLIALIVLAGLFTVALFTLLVLRHHKKNKIRAI